MLDAYSLLKKGTVSSLQWDEETTPVLQIRKCQLSVYILLPSKTHRMRVRWGAAGFEEMKTQVLPGLPRLQKLIQNSSSSVEDCQWLEEPLHQTLRASSRNLARWHLCSWLIPVVLLYSQEPVAQQHVSWTQGPLPQMAQGLFSLCLRHAWKPEHSCVRQWTFPVKLCALCSWTPEPPWAALGGGGGY